VGAGDAEGELISVRRRARHAQSPVAAACSRDILDNHLLIQELAKARDRMRATTSEALPAGNGTTRVTAWSAKPG